MIQRLFLFCLLVSYFCLAKAQYNIGLGTGINRYGVAISTKIYKVADENRKFNQGDWLFELGNIQHPREVALINNALQSSGIYKFGKINYAWALRPYYMGRYLLSARRDKKSVALNAVGGIGIPLAYSWPVYILLYNPQAGPAEVYTEVRYDPSIHDQSFIGGRAPFTRGLGSGKITPGIGFNTALEFSWGNYRTDVKIITLGMRVEAYKSKLPILHLNNLNQSTYSMFYLNFALGFGNY